MDSFCSYNSFNADSAISFFSKIRLRITSSTLDADRDNLVSKRPWILEKSFPFVFVIESISSWLVTITHAFPLQAVPKSSTMVWRLSINWVSSAIYCPISSTRKITWWFGPFFSQYSFTRDTNFSMLRSYPLLALLHQLRAASSLIKSIATIVFTILSWITANACLFFSHGAPAISSNFSLNSSNLPSLSSCRSNSARYGIEPQ